MKKRNIRYFHFLLMMWCVTAFNSMHAQSVLPPTNIEQIRTLSAATALTILQESGYRENDSVCFSIVPGEASVIVSQVFTQTMLERKLKPFSQKMDSLSTLPSLILQVVSVGVSYSPVFHESFLGTALTERKVGVKLAIQKTDKIGLVNFSREYYHTTQDTIDANIIPRLEDKSYRCSQGIAPERSFFDSILSPIIILSSLGLVVYLLFTVRS